MNDPGPFIAIEPIACDKKTVDVVTDIVTPCEWIFTLDMVISTIEHYHARTFQASC